MAKNDEGTAAPRMREIRFSDTDASSSLPRPKDPGPVKAPASADDKLTIVEWSKVAGHFDAGPPAGGYRRRGDRHRGLDVRVLIFHLRQRGEYVADRPITRAQYDALWAELNRETAMAPDTAMGRAVAGMVAHKGGFITKEEHARLTGAAKE